MSTRIRRRDKANRSRMSRGQTLVEFALILPIFLLLLFGLVDVGRYVYMHTTLSQAAREAARIASVEAYWVGSTITSCDTPGGPVCPADVDELRENVLDAANRMMTPFGTITDAELHTSCVASSASPPSGQWSDDTCASRESGSLVSVRVEFSIQAITPIIGQLIPSITSTASATMVIN